MTQTVILMKTKQSLHPVFDSYLVWHFTINMYILLSLQNNLKSNTNDLISSHEYVC